MDCGPVADFATSVRVLVVDDEPQVLECVASMLAVDGHQVSRTLESEGALAILRGGGVELLLCDVEMPGMSGLQLVEMVTPRYPALGIVLMSGKSELLEQAPGNVTRLSKPFALSALRDAVARSTRRISLPS